MIVIEFLWCSKQGLCFHYNEKFHLGHHYKRELFILVVHENDEFSDEEQTKEVKGI